jgi:hypothetical protein
VGGTPSSDDPVETIATAGAGAGVGESVAKASKREDELFWNHQME